jgi:hypothetical protein
MASALDTAASAESLSPAFRMWCLKGILALAMLSGFLLSAKLWVSSRSYPLTPVSSLLPAVPPLLDALWFDALLVLLLGIAVAPGRWARVAILSFVGLAALLSLWDQSRWQPWFYQYLCLLAALGLCPWGNTREQQQAALSACRLIVACTYFWSGLQKVNFRFVTEVYPWLMEPFLRLLPDSARPFLLAGWQVPLVEMAIGLGLLFRPTRSVAVCAAVGMHLFLLRCLGPLGHNWNTVIWPWNIALILSVVVLFWRTPEVPFRAVVWPRGSIYARVILVLFGFLPALNFVGLWDSYLSAALYSGTALRGTIHISEEVRRRLPEGVEVFVSPASNGSHTVDVFTWAITELNVPPNPERRIYRHIARELGARAGDPAGVRLLIEERPHWRTGVSEETWDPEVGP